MQSLSQQFPESDWIVAQAAVAQYNLRNFDGAQELFEDLIERDPHRVEVILFAHTLVWHGQYYTQLAHAEPLEHVSAVSCVASVGALLVPRTPTYESVKAVSVYTSQLPACLQKLRACDWCWNTSTKQTLRPLPQAQYMFVHRVWIHILTSFMYKRTSQL